jgi:type II secretory pathway pseudopilin PulG
MKSAMNPRCDKRDAKRLRAAFTLAEVLAALVFMAIVIPVAVHGLQVASRAGQVAQRKSIAARVGERVLNEITATHQYASTSQRGTAKEGPYEFRYITRLDPWERDAMRLLSVGSELSGARTGIRGAIEHVGGDGGVVMTGTKQSDVAVSNGSGAVRTPRLLLDTATSRLQGTRGAVRTPRPTEDGGTRRPFLRSHSSKFSLPFRFFRSVLVAINTVFYAALRLRNKTTQAIEDLTPTETCRRDHETRLDDDASAGGSLSGQLTTTPTSGGGMGQPGAIEFFTSSAIISDDEPWGDAQKISFYLRAPLERGRGKELVRAVTRNLLALTQEQPKKNCAGGCGPRAVLVL